MTYAPQLQVRALSLSRGTRQVLDNVSFTLDAGMGLCLRGANGSGKTSLLRCLAGLIDTASGDICLDAELADPSTLCRANVYCGHSDGLRAHLTVLDHCRLTATLYGWTGAQTALNQAITEAGLCPTTQLQDLSAGQRRRAALAVLLLLRRRIWLLDEPTAPLDAAGIEWVQGTLSAHLDRGGIAVVASHRPLLPNRLTEFWLHGPETPHPNGTEAAGP